MHASTNAPRPRFRGGILSLAGLALLIASGCSTIEALLNYFELTQKEPPFAITFNAPLTTQNASPGAPATIRWADIASLSGTMVRLRVDRVDPGTRAVISEIELVPARDALADGDADVFEWDVTGIFVGNYQPVVTMSSPDGRSEEVRARGDFVVISALPVPTLTFTNPAAADVSVAAGDTVTITWNDNGVANGDTIIALALDVPGSGHQTGNEIVIARDIAASDDGNTGNFTFDTNDADGNPVPPATYTLFAILDDGVHDNLGQPLTVDAVGRLIITP